MWHAHRMLLILAVATATHHISAQFARPAGYWTYPSEEARTDLFGALTDQQSQRENWYEVSPYIAEFWCTISNIGFLYVGAQHQSPAVLAAGIASIASHTVPRQWLHKLDILGVIGVLGRVAWEYPTIQHKSWLIIPAAVAGCVNAADAHLSRHYGYTWPHVLWHLTAAASIHIFLRNVV